VTRRYKAFISYSWADKAWSEWLHRTLETYRAPKGVADGQSLHPIFKDREEEAAGGSIGAAIETALGASEFLIVICSPRSAQSTWVNREVAWFKTHKDKGRILALIVDGEPGASATPGREAEECFPKTLIRKVGADLQPTEEWEDAPLAADARAEGDGKRGAKLKLAAALLGVGLDALVRRDERRRAARRRWAMSGMAAGMAALGGLSLFAFNQRDAAVAARNDAVKARDDAEGLIELVLTDLKSDLEGFGTLKSVTQIGNRAIGYYEGQDVKALTPDQLGRRARVLLMLGEADNKRGDLAAALARYETAAATTSEQLARDPENAQRIFDHAQSVFWVGYIAWQRGDLEKAKAQFTAYHDLAQKLVASDPANEDWQAELEYAYSNLGTLAMDEGEAAEAEGWFRKSLEIALARYRKAPTEADRVWAAGQAFAWLADALHRRVKLEEARRERVSELALYKPFLDEEVSNVSIAESAAIASYRLAQIELSSGHAESAAERSSTAVNYADRLLAADPAQIKFLDRAAQARTVYAESLSAMDRHVEAQKAIREAVTLAERLIALDGETVLWPAYTLAQPSLLMAKIKLGAGLGQDLDQSLDTLIEAQRQYSARSTDPVVRRVLISALALRARIDARFKNDWTEILALTAAKNENETPEGLVCLAEALLQTGKKAEALEMTTTLHRTGYRHPDFMALLERYPDLKTRQ
jgi:tetratricopeptide (TPR) repeat protein